MEKTTKPRQDKCGRHFAVLTHFHIQSCRKQLTFFFCVSSLEKEEQASNQLNGRQDCVLQPSNRIIKHHDTNLTLPLLRLHP